MKQHTWTNSAGVTYKINIVPPFHEELIKKEIAMPTQPGYWLEVALPDGSTKSEYFHHTDDTMTEVVFTENATNIITGWKGAKGETLRWQDNTTIAERRAWAGYKHKIFELENKIMPEKLFSGVICAGLEVDIEEGWLQDYVKRYGREPENIKLSYIVDKVCVAEEDYRELIIAINEARSISKERVNLIANSFREAKK